MFHLLLISCLNLFVRFCNGKDTSSVSLYNIVPTTPTCDIQKGSLVLRGDHIKFTEFTKDNGELKTMCNFEIKSLSIYASGGITIDRNIRAPGINLFVFAPVWEIINSRQINLNGKPHIKPHATPEKKGGAGNTGTHGNPGLPGNPAGNFVGLGDQFINGDKLVISVSGGDGQDGGDGGDGGDGEQGLYADKNHVSINCWISECDNGSPIETLSIRGKKHFFECYLLEKSMESLVKYCRFMIKGEEGKASGSGGNGGPGGNPGKPGHSELFELTSKSGIKTIKNLGNSGKDGMVGKAGKPGKNGYNVEYTFHTRIHLVVHSDPRREYQGLDIKNGVDGIVDYSKAMKPKAPIQLDLSECANDIVEYKSYLLETFNPANPSDKKLELYNKITESKVVMSVSDTLSLVNELRALEKSFHKLHRSVDFLPLYQSLLKRTAEYAKQPNSKSRTSADHKKVLTYLYTTILGREYNLKDRSESNLIVAIGEYLDLVKEDIQKYKEIDKITTIEKHKKNYVDSITLKTQEAQDLINSEILPELESALKENANNVEATVAKIVELEEKAKKDYQLIAKKKAEFESTMALSLFCEFLTGFSKIASLIPVVGGAVSVGTEMLGSSLKEGFDLNKPVNIPPSDKLYQGAKKSEGEVNKLKKDAIAALSDKIEFTLKELNEYPDVLYELITKVQDIKEKLKHATGIADISNLQEELYQLINNYKFKDLKVRNLETAVAKTPKGGKKPDKPDRQHVEDVVNIAGAGLGLPGVVFGVLNKNKQNEKIVAEFAEALKNNREYSNQLREHKNAITNEMGPALEMMSSNVLNVANSLGGKSQVSLDVTQWKLQSKLKQIISSVKEMTKGLNVTELFTNTFEKVKDALEVLIKLYDRIQSFQEDKNWANYIADINSAGSTAIKIGDGKLQSAKNWLDSIISCNIVIQQYQTAVDAFKQYVFPFADLFFGQLVLPDNLDYGDDLDGLVFKAETQINHLKRKYDEYRFVAKRYDSYVGVGNFDSNYRSTRPFFVWDYKTYKKMISKLLSGTKVMVLADVKKSTPRYDAVKFDQIEFNFKAKDKKTQLAVKNVLKDFQISAQHMGNSYFRSNDEYFMITTGKLDFWYTFEKDRSGNPIRQSLLIPKIKNGAFMLSPYATWELQLQHHSQSNRQAFQVLDKYKTLVDVELIGHGHFVFKHKLDIDLKINQYYTPIDSNNKTKG